MSIRKLVTIILLLGVTACGGSGGNNEPEVIIDKPVVTVDEPDVTVDEPTVEPAPGNAQSCSTVSCEETNKFVIEQIYNDVINSLNTGLVDSLYAEDFIQHNRGITAGITGQKAYFDTMALENPNHIATIKHIVADGDYVAVHWHYAEDVNDEFTGNKIMDLFKLTDGMIVEHWDKKGGAPSSSVSGNSVFSDLYIYPANTQANNDIAIEEENKIMVSEFYSDLFNNKNLDLIEELVDPNYLQHNLWVANGSGALFGFVSGGVLPVVIFLTLAEKDIVWTFLGTGEGNLVTIDLWRVDNNINKIVEHWDM